MSSALSFFPNAGIFSLPLVMMVVELGVGELLHLSAPERLRFHHLPGWRVASAGGAVTGRAVRLVERGAVGGEKRSCERGARGKGPGRR